MAALAYDGTDPVDPSPDRNLLLRMLDTLAEWQMRQSLRAICRGRDCCIESAGRSARGAL